MASNNTDIVNSLIERLQNVDPTLYDILFLLTADLSDLRETVIPTEIQRAIDTVIAAAPKTHAVDTFTYSVLPLSVRFNWSSTDPNVKQYELRKGTVWATADFQTRTIATQVDINPLPTGTHRFIVRTVNADGIISDDEMFVDVVIVGIGAPTISPQVIDNNVLLSWSAPNSPFQLSFYNIYREGVKIGEQSGTFFVYFEVFSGQFTYSVEAVDIVGNVGAIGSVTIDVGQPPDFVLEDSRVSELNGTLVNVIKIAGPKLLCCINTSETWHDHFASRGWDQIQDQVAAGYNVYGEPYATNGSYQEVIDYGAEFSSLVVNLDWSTNTLLGSVAANATIESSLDGVLWTDLTVGRSAFFTAMRYVRITINFTSTDDKSLIEFYNLRIFLNVKLVLTSGSVICGASDNDPETASSGTIGGTYVPFIKPYKDVNSITLTTNSKQPITPIYKFVDIANPDGFKIQVYDSSGNRIGQEVSWKVRGTL